MQESLHDNLSRNKWRRLFCRSFYPFFFLALLLFLPRALEAVQTIPLYLSARSALLIDANTSRVLFSKAPHIKRAPASTVKLLTAMVVMDHVALDEAVTAGSRAAKMPSTKIHLRRGERFYVRDLIRALLISSANDAAVALAEKVAGSESRFTDLMNKKARSIGARNSHFLNASGLPRKGQYTTAYDLAQVMKAVSKYPFLTKTIRLRTAAIRSLAGRKVRLKNHNKMMWRDTRPLFGKTGWTRKSQHCFAGHIDHAKHKVLVVTMGSRSPWSDLKKILDYSYGTYRGVTRRGSSGRLSRTRIKDLQSKLKSLGFDPGPVDGKFGPKTSKAVTAFQKTHGLNPDGIVGPRTLSKMKEILGS